MCHIFAGQDPERYACETRSMRLNGLSTSIRLERAFWSIIEEIAAGEGLTTPAFVSRLHSEVLEVRGEAHNFTSLLRSACLIYLDRKASGSVAPEGSPSGATAPLRAAVVS